MADDPNANPAAVAWARTIESATVAAIPIPMVSPADMTILGTLNGTGLLGPMVPTSALTMGLDPVLLKVIVIVIIALVIGRVAMRE